jgi:hypothetical protein
MEIVNLVSLAEEKLRRPSPVKLSGRCLFRMLHWFYLYYTRPESLKRWVMQSAVADETALWDRMLAENPSTISVAGCDAHARIKIAKWGLKAPTYRHAFGTAQTYAVTLEPLNGDADHDRRLIYDAFRSGRTYAVCPRTGSARQFSFVAQEDDREVTMGQRLAMKHPARLVIDAPNEGRTLIRLLRNGQEAATVQGDRLVWNATKPGIYRAEAYEIAPNMKLAEKTSEVRDIAERVRRNELSPWIFSNPIRLDPVPAARHPQDRSAEKITLR